MQNIDTKYDTFTEMAIKTYIISSLTYWKALNNRIENGYNLLILKKLGIKTA